VDGDEHAAASGQRFEDPSVVSLEADAAHGAGDAQTRKVV
jgi:hypothetical protein